MPNARTMHATVVFAATLALIGYNRPVECARILAIETVCGKSHWNFMSGVLRELTDNGHNVTVFTPFPDGDRENYTEVDISGLFPVLVAKELAQMTTFFNTYWNVIGFGFFLGRTVCDGLAKNDRMNEILKRGLRENFDALLVEPVIGSTSLTHMAAEADLPVIYTVPTATLFLKEFPALGETLNPAVVPAILADHAVPKTFARRFENTLTVLYANILIVVQESMLRVFDPKPYDSYPFIPPSLVFMNSHFVSEVSSPVPSNVVWVGGIHLKPAQKLPKDILEFIDDSPNGVVLFTLGSVVAITSVPEDVQKAFLDALSELPQRVLLKYEGELKDKPKNVMTRKWLPQRDILKHPNVKLFVSHGGISGMYEAVDAGVPVLGFSLFGDQHRNVDHLVESGMAISMDLLSVTKNTFLANVLELLNDEKYTRNAEKTSKIFNDRPVSPQKLVTYWTEYVIRHKGAPHLKSPGLNLTWYQYLLLDVLGVMLLLVCISLICVYKAFGFIKRLLVEFTHFTTKTKSE